VIIGICGAAGAGKDTIATHLEARYRFGKIAFADPLYAMVSAMTGIGVESLRDRKFKEAVLPVIGQSPRRLLQTLGTEWGRGLVADDIWIRIAIQKASSMERAVISDVRFDNEAEAIKSAGGSVWLVTRPDAKCLDSTAATHSSERGISPHLIDATIVNGGAFSELSARVDAAYHKATAAYN